MFPKISCFLGGGRNSSRGTRREDLKSVPIFYQLSCHGGQESNQQESDVIIMSFTLKYPRIFFFLLFKP